MAEPKTKKETKNENAKTELTTTVEEKPASSPQTPPTPPPPAPAAAPTTPATPTSAPATPPPAAATEKPKKPVWLWVLVGCLVLVIISLAGVGILGWLGIKQVKSLIQKYEPTINQTQNTLDTVNQEAAQWQQKSEEFRKSMPSAEDMEKLQQDMVPPGAIPQQE